MAKLCLYVDKGIGRPCATLCIVNMAFTKDIMTEMVQVVAFIELFKAFGRNHSEDLHQVAHQGSIAYSLYFFQP
jgi:hypothetical protein